MNQNDFDKINQRIQQTINDASDNLQRIIDNPRWSSIYGGIPNPIKRDGTRNVVRPDGSTDRSGGQTPPVRPKPRLFENLSGKKTGGIVSLVSGIIAERRLLQASNAFAPISRSPSENCSRTRCAALIPCLAFPGSWCGVSPSPAPGWRCASWEM